LEQQAFPQQVSFCLHEVLPQHVSFGFAQNGMPFPGQHGLFGGHEVLPQHVLGCVTQNGAPLVGVQHFLLLPQVVLPHTTCASTVVTPSVARIPPATNPPSRFSACRRGISLASMRAA